MSKKTLVSLWNDYNEEIKRPESDDPLTDNEMTSLQYVLGYSAAMVTKQGDLLDTSENSKAFQMGYEDGLAERD